MSDQVSQTVITLFESNMKLALGQTQSKLWPLSIERPGKGEKVQLDDLIGHVKAQTYETRHADINLQNTPHSRVWVPKPLARGYADMVDRDDQLAATIALESGYMMTAAGTINRAKDDAWLSGFYGNMLTGREGTTSNVFPTGNVCPVDVGAGAATRMNVAKLRWARKKLAQNFADMEEERFFVLTAEQIDDLLNEVPVTSKDFAANGGELRDGKLVRMLGFTLIEFELGNTLLSNTGLTVDGNGYRKNPFFVRSGMARVPWQELWTDISAIPMKRGSRLIQAETTVAATRTENGKVGYVLNSEA